MNYQKIINQNIKSLRIKNGLTQEVFAEKIGVSIQGLSNIERNKYQPNAETINRICEAFSIKPQELLVQNSNIENEIIENIDTLLKSCSKNKLKKIYEIIKLIVNL